MNGPLEQIIIYQNLFRPTLTAEIKLNDGNAITELAPLIGMERLHLRMKVPQEKQVTNLTFRIIDIRERSPFQGGQTGQSYVMDLVSEERMMNAYHRVSKKFEGTVSSIVKQIYDDYLDLGKRNDEFFPRETMGNIRYLAPNIHPFEIIANLSQYTKSTVDQSSIFCFYEDFKGFHYENIHYLFQQESLNLGGPYTWQFKNFGRQSVREQFMIMEGVVIQNSFPNMINSLKNGHFAATLYTHDIYNKKINNGPSKGLTTYNYLKEFNGVGHTGKDDYPLLPIGGSNINSNSNLNAIKLSKLENAKKSYIEVVPQHSAMYGTVESDNLSAPNFRANDIALHRNSQKHQVESFRLSIRVAGHPALEVGQCVDLDIQSFVPADNFVRNEILSGKYLIAEAVHHFNHAYYHCDLTLLKDASGVNLDTVQIQPFEVGENENS